MKTLWQSKRQLILYGVLMGGAGLIPGFSSGTMAYTLSIYPLLVGTFAGVIKTPLHWLVWVDALILMMFMGLGAYLMSFVIEFLLIYLEIPMMWLFIGFILGSVFLLRLEFDASTTPQWVLSSLIMTFCLFLLSFVIRALPPLTLFSYENGQMRRFFLVSVAAAIAGLLPGISGSVIWIVSGQYPRYLGVIKQLIFTDLLVFIFGSFLGYVFFSILIEQILKRHPVLTYSALTALTLASILWMIRIDLSWSIQAWLGNVFLPLGIGITLFYGIYLRYQYDQRRDV